MNSITINDVTYNIVIIEEDEGNWSCGHCAFDKNDFCNLCEVCPTELFGISDSRAIFQKASE